MVIYILLLHYAISCIQRYVSHPCFIFVNTHKKRSKDSMCSEVQRLWSSRMMKSESLRSPLYNNKKKEQNKQLKVPFLFCAIHVLLSVYAMISYFWFVFSGMQYLESNTTFMSVVITCHLRFNTTFMYVVITCRLRFNTTYQRRAKVLTTIIYKC